MFSSFQCEKKHISFRTQCWYCLPFPEIWSSWWFAEIGKLNVNSLFNKFSFCLVTFTEPPNTLSHSDLTSPEKILSGCRCYSLLPETALSSWLLQYSTQCVSGCMCPFGLVSDGKGDCIPMEECPCIHNDATYKPGEKIKIDCNTW